MPATDAPYVIPTDIGQILPQPITATSRPNFNAVGSMIWTVSAEVEAAAAYVGYSVPIPTAAEGFALVAGIVKNGVAYEAAKVMFPGNGPGSGSPLADEFKADYIRALENLRAGKSPLIGASLDTGADHLLPRSYSTTNPSSSSDSFAPMVTWDMEF